jgi:NADH-quinone oxidoreductase subunit H
MTPLTWWQEAVISLTLIGVIVGALLGLFSLMTWVERRLLAFMQFRLGPNRAGPLGLFQPIADGIKLFFKEELIPTQANKWAFLGAPVLAMTTALTSIAVLPYGPPIALPQMAWLPEWLAWLSGRTIPLQIADLDVGVLYLFAVASLGVYGIVLAGWGANNKYTLMGGLRSSAQLFSYELALGLSWVGVILLAGSLRIADIVASQGSGRVWGLPGLLSWNCFIQFPAFVVYLLAATAEVNRIPFDVAEAEAELVAGFHTEYGSMKFALIQMAEYVNMITVSVLATNLFLGGWLAPLPVLQRVAGVEVGMLWFVAKVAVLLFVFIWMRGTLPRVRYDQLMRFGWLVLIPVAVVWILITAAAVVLLGAR